MPNMPNPFAANLSGQKLTHYDLVQAVRTDIIGELKEADDFAAGETEVAEMPIKRL